MSKVIIQRFFEVGGDGVGEGLGREDGGVAGVLHRPVAHGFQIHGHAGGGFVAGGVGDFDVAAEPVHHVVDEIFIAAQGRRTVLLLPFSFPERQFPQEQLHFFLLGCRFGGVLLQPLVEMIIKQIGAAVPADGFEI